MQKQWPVSLHGPLSGWKRYAVTQVTHRCIISAVFHSIRNLLHSFVPTCKKWAAELSANLALPDTIMKVEYEITGWWWYSDRLTRMWHKCLVMDVLCMPRWRRRTFIKHVLIVPESVAQCMRQCFSLLAVSPVKEWATVCVIWDIVRTPLGQNISM